MIRNTSTSTWCRSHLLPGLQLFLIATLILSTSIAQAHHLGSKQKLSCNKTFPCQDEIVGRVQFWVDVFSKWANDEIILHDKDRPERVFAVIKTTASCTDKRSKKRIERYRGSIASELRTLAKRIETGATVFNDEEQHLLQMFPSRSAKHVKSAAGRIRCQQGNRTRFVAALSRFEQYRPMVERILADKGIPDDVKYLPFVESAYNPDAYSRVGAAGLWQIMPRTAQSLGLRLNATLDERLDPEAATRAASVYLSRARVSLDQEARKQGVAVNESKLNPFVITSYNYGVAGMRRAVRAHGLDFVTVLNKYKSRSFRTAVRNFYASFLAARHVAKNQNSYFSNIKKRSPNKYNVVKLKHATSLDRIQNTFGVSADTLKPLNPALTRFIWHRWRFIPAGYNLRLPVNVDNWSTSLAKFESMPVEEESSAGSTYRVKRGDTACAIADAFRVKCRDLVGANQLGRRAVIRVGQKLTIPGKRSKGSTQSAVAASSSTATSYKVRRGDTPCGISRKLGVNCKTLMASNGLGARSVIRPGQVLKLQGNKSKDNGASEQAASSTAVTSVTVKRGDTPCGIARQLGVSCNRLMRENKISKRGLIRVGQRLSIPGRTDGVATADEVVDSTGTDVAIAEYATVKKGDSACKIARRVGVPCERFMRQNNLSASTVIRPGQRLVTKPGSAPAEGSKSVERTITVRAGDTPCALARRHSMSCAPFMTLNDLDKGAVIRVGQVLRVLSTDAGPTGVAANAPAPTSDDSIAATDSVASASEEDDIVVDESDPMALIDASIDLSVVPVSGAANKRFSIRVEAEETVGHYADWLDIGYAGPVRRLNGLGGSATVLIGQRIVLPVDSDEQLEKFKTRRADYHRLLIEEFKEHFVVDKIDQYRVRPGDSSWSIAEGNDMPLWLLTKFNHGLRSKPPKLGQVLRLPVIARR